MYWTGPSCHRGTVPKIELLLSPGPAGSGLWAGVLLLCWQTSSAQLLRDPPAPLHTLLSWQEWSLLNSSSSSLVWQQIFSTVLLIISIRQIPLVCCQKIIFWWSDFNLFLPNSCPLDYNIHFWLHLRNPGLAVNGILHLATVSRLWELSQYQC